MIKGIKNLADDDRPREKFIGKGKKALSNAELLAILLGSGNDKENALELAQHILNDFENKLDRFAGIESGRLMKYRGVGMAKAVTVLAALELGLRTKNTKVQQKTRYNSSVLLFEVLVSELSFRPFEHFVLLTFNNSLELINKHVVSEGGLEATLVDVRKIAYHCVLDRASAIAIAHNHPSGNIKASENDNKVTRKVKEMCNVFGYRFLDHIIVGGNNYYSYSDDGLL